MSIDLPRNPETASLPVVRYCPRIVSVLEQERRLILTAAPGAGKSTVIPLALLEASFLQGKKILMLEPRRLAAVSIASRMADLYGEKPGQTVGYRVRHETKTSRRTRLEVVTEALLTRMILSDPGLEGIGLVIFDEFHERSIHTDTAFAFIREIISIRNDLSILVMSATMNTERVSRALDDAPIIACPGRTYPVDIRYDPIPPGRNSESIFAERLSGIASREEGDILAFLPGTREIRKTKERLGELLPEIEILPLHGLLSLDEQKKACTPDPGGRKRIILATSVAETSLTVPGIRIVADSGYARFTRFHERSGMDHLVTERVSAHQADQRSGRAGRTASGISYRFWRQDEVLRTETEPEILRSDLAGTVLEAAAWGTPGPADLPWLDLPPEAAWSTALTLLRGIGAVDGHSALTESGKQMLRLGVSPRIGALLLEGGKRGMERLACVCAALLDGRGDPGAKDDADFRLTLERLRTGRSPREFGSRVTRDAAFLLKLLSGSAGACPESLFSWNPDHEADVGSLLSAGFPDRIAKNTGSGLFRFPSGRQAGIRGTLSTEPWITAVEADAGSATGTIYLAAPIGEPDVLKLYAGKLNEERRIGWKNWKPGIRTVTKLGAIVIRETAVNAVPREELELSFSELVRKEGLSVLPWDERAEQFLLRLHSASLRARESGIPETDFPDFSETVLSESVHLWLAPFIRNPPGQALDTGILRQALEARVPWSMRAFVDRESPAAITLPSGQKKHITYRRDGEPFAAIRIQDVFGMSSSPAICGRPLVLHLLSPSMRPLQITDDLAGFWKNTYPEVRKEMRGRYPKHRWPENPLEAEPGAFTKRRMPE